MLTPRKDASVEEVSLKNRRRFIAGILIMCVGMQIANYGTAVCLSGEINRMDAMDYYVLVSSLGSLGMMLILPITGRLTEMMGLRRIITVGILVQLLGRLVMIFSNSWIPYALGFLLQSIGGGCYISSAYVNMSSTVEPHQRTKYFGYIPVANAIGAVLGPLLVSAMYSAGGITAKLAYIINLPVTLIGFLLAYQNCSTEKTPGAAKNFDYPGLFLTVIGVACMILWLNLGGKSFKWFDIPSLIMVLAAAVCLIWLVRRELSIDNPAVPIRMFRNKRMTAAFLCAMVASAYSTCSASYSIMWIRLNYSAFPGATIFNGTASMPQQVVMVILGLFLGTYIGNRFSRRFRPFGILSMVAAMIATGLLFCLKFTGTAADNNLVTFGSFPLGMLLIWIAVAIGGFTSVVAQSSFSAFWQSNTPREEIPSGQALYSFGSTGGSCVFGATVGVVMGSSGDYTRAFATGFAFAVFGLFVALAGFRFTKKELEA